MANASAHRPKLGSGKRFSNLSHSLARQHGSDKVRDPDALAAAIGRKKYGKKKFAALGRRGK